MRIRANWAVFGVCAALGLSCGKAPELPPGAIVLRMNRYPKMDGVRIDVWNAVEREMKHGPLLRLPPRGERDEPVCVVIVPSSASSDWTPSPSAAAPPGVDEPVLLRVLPLEAVEVRWRVDFAVNVEVAFGAEVREYDVPLPPACSNTTEPSCFETPTMTSVSCVGDNLSCRFSGPPGAQVILNPTQTCRASDGQVRCNGNRLTPAPRVHTNPVVDPTTGCIAMTMP